MAPTVVVVVVEAAAAVAAAATAAACCFRFFRILLAIVGFIIDNFCVVGSRATVLFCVDMLVLLLPSATTSVSKAPTEAVLVTDGDWAAPVTFASFLLL